MQQVFVVDKNNNPLMPCHPARARELLDKGKAAVLRHYPFIADSNIEQTRSSFKSRLRLIHLSKVGCSTDQNVRTLTEFAIRSF